MAKVIICLVWSMCTLTSYGQTDLSVGRSNTFSGIESLLKNVCVSYENAIRMLSLNGFVRKETYHSQEIGWEYWSNDYLGLAEGLDMQEIKEKQRYAADLKELHYFGLILRRTLDTSTSTLVSIEIPSRNLSDLFFVLQRAGFTVQELRMNESNHVRQGDSSRPVLEIKGKKPRTRIEYTARVHDDLVSVLFYPQHLNIVYPIIQE